jgi:hypothetical protein
MYITLEAAQCGITVTVIFNLTFDPEVGHGLMGVTGVQIGS